MLNLLKPEEKVVYTLRDLYRRMGYAPFKMSKFETYELYMQNKDFLVSDGVITFTDADGILMALKPDVTLSIVKNYRRDETALQKVYYSENVYRREGSGQTFREIMQAGLECLGDVGCYELCEVILLAVKSLQAISNRFVLDLSHMQIVSDVLDSLELDFDRRTQLLKAIADKNEDALDLPECDTAPLLALLRTCGPIKTVLPQLTALCTTPASQDALRQLRMIGQVLDANGLADHVQLDFSIVNDMNYYNGIVFCGYVEGIPAGVLSGGQYDKLMEKMNKNAGGVGFAVYLDHLERLDAIEKKYDVDIVLLYDPAVSISEISQAAKELTSDGSSVLVLKQKPENLRFRQLMQYENERVILLENNG